MTRFIMKQELIKDNENYEVYEAKRNMLLRAGNSLPLLIRIMNVQLWIEELKFSHYKKATDISDVIDWDFINEFFDNDLAEYSYTFDHTVGSEGELYDLYNTVSEIVSKNEHFLWRECEACGENTVYIRYKKYLFLKTNGYKFPTRCQECEAKRKAEASVRKNNFKVSRNYIKKNREEDTEEE